ncbi:ABC transporter ATP-binding protein [Aquidulcibacter sp.]|uniref:ABC transporter ATP-binding protein n=1 Tax=Aquidulcibacter sp. TaxID=2052990 RepID=UPI0025BDCC64|nr:ABC transporter ATP-binding protein [Aquidulcibacter sp.]MCA3692655.1 ABC transporter ATP-binding protein [Aquidulcibacter sp.]
MKTITKAPATQSGSSTDLIKRFWSGWLTPHAGVLFLATLLMAVVAAASASYPWLFGQVIDALAKLSAGQEARPEGAPAWMAPAAMAMVGPLAIIAATMIKGVALYASTVLTNRVALAATTKLQQDLFAKLLTLDFARLSAEPSGAFSARFLNDINAVREAVLRAANSLVRDILTLIGVIGVMILGDWQLALVCLVILPLAIGPVSMIGARLRKTAARAQHQAADLAGVVEESLGGIRLVKTYGLEKAESSRVGTALSTRMSLLLKMAEQKGRVDPILEVLGGLAIAGVFAFAGFRITQGAASVGTLTAFIASLLLAAQSIRSLGGLNSVLQEGLSALERFFSVLDETPSIADRPGAKELTRGPGRIEFQNVGFNWPNGTIGLNAVNFTAEPGQTLALVGPSGSGKSTILNLIPRLFDPTTGRVLIDGQDIGQVTLASLRQHIALVSQDATLFDASIAENVAMGLPAADEAAIRSALSAAACDFVDRLADGMATQVGPRGSRLSGGERQRLSLARAIVRDSPILLLDEPTSALDSDSEARVQEALDRFAANRTTIVVAHRLSTVRRANLILVLNQGQIVEAGTHDQLIARGGLYAELAALQFQTTSQPEV